MKTRNLFMQVVIFLAIFMIGTIGQADVVTVGVSSNSVGVTTVTHDSALEDINYESPNTVRIPITWTVNSGTASFNDFSFKSTSPKSKKDPVIGQLINVILVQDSAGADSTGQIDVLFKFTGLYYDKRAAVTFGDALFVLKLNMDRNGDGSTDRALNCKTSFHVEGLENVNTPPVADAGPESTVSVSSMVTLDGSGSSDENSDILTYQWSFVTKPFGSTATLSDSTIESPTFVADLYGVYDIQLIVNDGTVDSIPATVRISANTGPIADAGSNQAAKIGDVVTLDGSGSTDPDGYGLSYQWSLAEIPAGSTATLFDPTAVNPSIKVDLVGTYVAQLTVSDGGLNGGPAICYITVTEEVDGVLLSGDPDVLAINGTYNKPPKADVDPSEVVDGIIMTRMDIYVSPDATVGEVNAALTAVGGVIVSMEAGSLGMTIAVPRQQNLESFQALADILSNSPGIFYASVGREIGLSELPGGAAGSDAERDRLDHLIAAKFPAAWNARSLATNGCNTRKVKILVGDKFDLLSSLYEPLRSNFNSQVPPSSFKAPSGIGNPRNRISHGYDVVTTLGALFDASVPTGANPFTQCLDIVGVQALNTTGKQFNSNLVAEFPPPGEKFVINGSLGFIDSCGTPQNPNRHCADADFGPIVNNTVDRTLLTIDWIKQTNSRWDDFLVASAAGNELDENSYAIYRGMGTAVYTSWFNIATLPDLYSQITFLNGFLINSYLWAPQFPTDPSGVPFRGLVLKPVETKALEIEARAELPNLYTLNSANNVLITGSSKRPVSPVADELEESDFSDKDPDLLAVGEGKISFANSLEGSSYSAPQVAGLASYMWLLSPDLRNRPSSDTRSAILNNTRQAGIVPKQLDAYAAILSLDEAIEPSETSAPVRLAILDSDNDGNFDHDDLAEFQQAYVDQISGDLLQPADPDHSRHDLNGDGYTGGERLPNGVYHHGRFDLDRIGSTQYGQTIYTTVTQTIEGQEVTFNEEELSDMEILCYYAYSPMYTGDEDQRKDLLGLKYCTDFSVSFKSGDMGCGYYRMSSSQSGQGAYCIHTIDYDYDYIPFLIYDTSTGFICDETYYDSFEFTSGWSQEFITEAFSSNGSTNFTTNVSLSNDIPEATITFQGATTSSPPGFFSDYFNTWVFGGSGGGSYDAEIEISINNKFDQDRLLEVSWAFVGTYGASSGIEDTRSGWYSRMYWVDQNITIYNIIANNTNGQFGEQSGIYYFTIPRGRNILKFRIPTGVNSTVESCENISSSGGYSSAASMTGQVNYKLLH